MNPAPLPSFLKRRRLLSFTLLLFLLCLAFAFLLSTDEKSASPPRVEFVSAAPTNNSPSATFDLLNTSNSRIHRFGYFRIEGPSITRQMIRSSSLTVTINPREKETINVQLPPGVAGELRIRFFGSRPRTAFQKGAEIVGELLAVIGIQAKRLQALYDYNATSWEVDCLFSITPPAP